ncbi:MAG TPA: cytochrome c [Candidatus Acidoferrum sp.]|nr:cytochrome c [Candidatus Acidoferrum sp.]
MRRILVLFALIVLLSFGVSFAQQSSKPPGAEPVPEPIPAEAIAKVNPVKPTPEGLEQAKKLYGYHCSMCHGKNGDGKGDLAEQMKLNLHDWRDASSIAKMTDGELFYIITNGRGKMTGGEGDRTKDEVRWQLVNYVRSFGTKAADSTTSK